MEMKTSDFCVCVVSMIVITAVSTLVDALHARAPDVVMEESTWNTKHVILF